MCVDFWVEVASPVKNGIKRAFYDFAKKQFENSGIILSSYLPFTMGGDMRPQDYLINMNINDAPENLLTMGFGEISDCRFYEKYIRTGVYSICKTVAWFPEPMVIDIKRLGNRPLPENYVDLANPCYKDEVCIIGTPKIPDPLVTLFIYKEYGKETAESFSKNIHMFGAPVNAIRHLGRNTNSFGSIFIMPVLFANVCKEKKYAKVIESKNGLYAEPFVLLSKNPSSEKSRLIDQFVHSEEFRLVFAEKCFPVLGEGISEVCKENYFLELEDVYSILDKNFLARKL